MKRTIMRRMAAMLLGGVVLAGTVAAMSAGDSLVSLRYLTDNYIPAVKAQANNLVERELLDAYNKAVQQQGNQSSGEQTAATQFSADLGLKNGVQAQELVLQPGGVFVPYSGVIQVQSGATVINATTGQEVPPGSNLTGKNRYIIGQEAAAALRVLSGSATFGIQGGYEISALGHALHPFLDVTLSDWYNDAVGYAYTGGFFAGRGDGLFAPYEAMDRAMVMTVFFHLAGDPKEEMDAAEIHFADVAAEQWFAPYVSWGAQQGVTAGTGDGMFSPTVAVTRQQMVMLLYNFGKNYLGLNLAGRSDLTGLAGADQISDWALDAMQWAAANGILQPDSPLAPEIQITRAQVADMLKNFSQTYL